MRSDRVVPVGLDGKPRNAAARDQLEPRQVLTLFAGLGAAAATCFFKSPVGPDTRLPWVVNPTGLLGCTTFAMLLAGCVLVKFALNAALTLAMGKLQALKIDEVEEGEGKVRTLMNLDVYDLAFVYANSLIEFIGMQHVAAFIMSGYTHRGLAELYSLNVVCGLYLVMFTNDLMYYAAHVFAHRRLVFPWVHRQHHRQCVPFRGHVDAANQHPMEVVGGFAFLLGSMYIASMVTGLHAVSAVVAVLYWVVLNILNHLPFDSDFHFPMPYPAHPRDHQMHCRYQNCNYGLLSGMADRYFGTFREYRSLSEPEPEAEGPKKWYEDLKDPALDEVKVTPPPPPAGRPDIFPSAWSFCALMPILVSVAVLLEVVHTGALPDLRSTASMVKTLILLANGALFCWAVESQCNTPVEDQRKYDRMYNTVPRMNDKMGRNKYKEAVPRGLVKSMAGGKSVWKTSLKESIPPKAVKRE